MAFLTAAALALAAGTMAYGVYEQQEGRDRAQEGYATQQQGYALQQQGSDIQAEAARQQAGISKEQAANSVFYAGRERDLNQLASMQSIGFSANANVLNNQIAASEQALEGQRRVAMELDARRRNLEIVRNQQRGRSMALAAATAQGARRGSGLQGGYAQISGQTGVNMLGVNQNLQIGESTSATSLEGDDRL